MHYRRLGRTEWMVSEVGLALRALEGLDEAAAGAVLGAALPSGVTLLLVDVREHEGGVEPLVGRVVTTERPRFVVVSRFERAAESSTFASQMQAAGGRLSKEAYLDVALFPQVPDAAQCAILNTLAETRTVRAWGIETSDVAVATKAFAAGARVLVTPAAAEVLVAAAAEAGAGIIVAGDSTSIASVLADSRVTAVVAEATTTAEIETLTRAAG